MFLVQRSTYLCDNTACKKMFNLDHDDPKVPWLHVDLWVHNSWGASDRDFCSIKCLKVFFEWGNEALPEHLFVSKKNRIKELTEVIRKVCNELEDDSIAGHRQRAWEQLTTVLDGGFEKVSEE